MRIWSDNDDPETDWLGQQDFMQDQIDRELKQSMFLVPVTRRIWILITATKNMELCLLWEWHIANFSLHTEGAGNDQVFRINLRYTCLQGSPSVSTCQSSFHFGLNSHSPPLVIHVFTVVVVQLLSHVQLFATPWTATHQAFLSFTVSWSSLKLKSVESMMPSNHLILCHPLLLLPLSLSQHQDLSQWVGSLHQVKVLKLQLQHQSFQWIFRTNFH